MIRSLWGRPQPEIPVQFVRNRRGFSGTLGPFGTPVSSPPGIIGQAAPGIHFPDFTDSAILYPFSDESNAFTGMALNPHLGGDTVAEIDLDAPGAEAVLLGVDKAGGDDEAIGVDGPAAGDRLIGDAALSPKERLTKTNITTHQSIHWLR